MSDLTLSVDWDKVLAESAAESMRALQQLEAVDWDEVLAESMRASQQLEAVDWRKMFDEANITHHYTQRAR